MSENRNSINGNSNINVSMDVNNGKIIVIVGEKKFEIPILLLVTMIFIIAIMILLLLLKKDNVEICSLYSDSNPMSGIVLQLTGKDEKEENIQFVDNQIKIGKNGKILSIGDKIEWISGDESTVIKNLKDGKYDISEIEIPEGYKRSDSVKNFTVEDGKVIGENKIVITYEKITTTSIANSTTTINTTTETTSGIYSTGINTETNSDTIKTTARTLLPPPPPTTPSLPPTTTSSPPPSPTEPPTVCNNDCIFDCNLIGDGVEIRGYKDLDYYGLEIIIPSYVPGLEAPVKYIADDAFTGYNNIGKVSYIEIPDTVEKIGCFAFAGCNSIDKIVSGAEVKYFGDQCFIYDSTKEPLPELKILYHDRPIFENNWYNELKSYYYIDEYIY